MRPILGLSDWERGANRAPQRPMDQVRAGIDRIFEELGLKRRPGEPRRNDTETVTWDPDVAIYRNGDRVVVRADLPKGIDKKHVHVDVADDSLVISGEVPSVLPAGEMDHHRSERNHGTFFRSIPLVPGADAEHCAAHFKDGVLEVEFELPREPRTKTTHIEIK